MTQTVNRSDNELKTAVVEELWRTPSANAENIDAAVAGGIITRAGEVVTYPGKFLAGRAASPLISRWP